MNKNGPYEKRKQSFLKELDISIHTLEGILKGIVFDKNINSNELKELETWCSDNISFSDKHPFNEIFSVLNEFLKNKIHDGDELENILWLCGKFSSPNYYFDIVTSDIQRLQGILHGIMADNVINDEEIVSLQKWLKQNRHLEGVYPYDELKSLIADILKDRSITDEERGSLKIYFGEFINFNKTSRIKSDKIDKFKKEITLKGICSVKPVVKIKGRSFSFAGRSSKSDKNEIERNIVERGGVYQKAVSADTNYLIIGDNGNSCWGMACYGRKVEEAVVMRKNGSSIRIIHESDFWKALK